MITTPRVGFASVAVLSVFCLSVARPAAAQFSSRNFTGDFSSAISSSKTYTHAVNFNGGSVTVNGVLFTAGNRSGTDSTSGDAFALTGTPYSTGNNGNLSGNINTVAATFFYGDAPAETLTLSGLTAGTSYITTFYNVGYGDPGERLINLSDSVGNVLNNYDENQAGSENGNLLTDAYTATSSSITITFAPQSGNTFHQYGFTNEIAGTAAAPEPSALLLLAPGVLGLVAARRRTRRAAR